MFDLLDIILRSTVVPLAEGLGATKQDLDVSEFPVSGKGGFLRIPARAAEGGRPERPASYQALLDAALRVASGPNCVRVVGRYVNPEDPEGLPYGFHIAKVTQTDALVRDVPEPHSISNRPKAPVHYAQVGLARRGEISVAYIDDSASDFFDGLVGIHKFLFRAPVLGKEHLATGNAIDRYHGRTRTDLTVPIYVGDEQMAAMQLYQNYDGDPVYVRLAIAGPTRATPEKTRLISETLCAFTAATGALWQIWQEDQSERELERYAHAAFSERRAGKANR